MASNLAATVRSIRRELGLSQEALARSMGVSAKTVSRYEKGAPAEPFFLLKMVNAIPEDLGRELRKFLPREFKAHEENSGGTFELALRCRQWIERLAKVGSVLI